MSDAVLDLEEMSKWSEQKMATVKEDIEEMRKLIRDKMLENLDAFPEELKKEIEHIKERDKAPDLIIVSSLDMDSLFTNFVLDPDPYEKEEEKKRALKKLEEILQHVNMICDQIAALKNSKGANTYVSIDAKLKELPSLQFVYDQIIDHKKESIIKNIGAIDESIISLSMQIRLGESLIGDFTRDIQRNNALKDRIDLSDVALQSPLVKEILDVVEGDFDENNEYPTDGEGVLWTKTELKILKSIYEGKPLDLSSGTKGKEKDRETQQRNGGER